ncbi:hypothetical protein CALCODRAFT_488037, partial [Calocera cornea HHB12733]
SSRPELAHAKDEGSGEEGKKSEKRKGKGKAREVDGSQETQGSGSAVRGRGSEQALKMAAIALVRSAEQQFGAVALLDGMPLIGLMEQEGLAQDTVSRPKLAVAKPEDQAEVDEYDEAVEPAVDRKTQPAFAPPTLAQLLEECFPDKDVAKMSTEEWETELRQRMPVVAFEYGRQLRRKQLIDEQVRKEEVLRQARLAEHGGVWDGCVGVGMDWVDTHEAPLFAGQPVQAAAAVTVAPPEPDVAPVTLEQILGNSKHGVGHDAHEGGHKVHEGGKKFFPAVKKALVKYGPGALRAGFKLGVETLAQGQGGDN